MVEPMRIQLSRAFNQGVACALAEAIRLHGSEAEAADVLQGFGLSRADLKAAGVEDEDMAALEPALSMNAPPNPRSREHG